MNLKLISITSYINYLNETLCCKRWWLRMVMTAVGGGRRRWVLADSRCLCVYVFMEEGVSMEVQDLLTTKVEEMMIGIVRCEMDMEELDHNKGGRMEVRTVSREQLYAIRDAVHDEAEANARPVQALNNRWLKLYRPDDQQNN
ncbi:Alpha carbonic anhydrase [Artemisia annua]|uniref:Alpha carbonic anhydrase n=1 Tax=Artemisia annua TaxID=35608 RepID=A0A2U1L420_ARTAN|nr:Alpha carbonic anhydrase [Artemisia annua]